MPVVFSYAKVDSRIDENRVDLGSLERPATVTVDGEVYDRVASIANAANSIVYADQLTSFNFVMVQSDQDVRLLITDNASSSFSVTVKGTGVLNKYGVGFMLGSDKTASSSVRINSLQAFNTSGATAKVRVLIVK